MPSIIINGVKTEFKPGQTILQVANDLVVRGEVGEHAEIPQYCYHDGLSVVASCRICLAECYAQPQERGDRAVHGRKLIPTCQTPAVDGMVVHTDSPKAVANQKAVMEFLLINHPLDCPVCDQSGECFLQDYSYQFGRGTSRFEEQKVKQPKKDMRPNVLLYSDRCIMCTRCVRFTREVAGTSELMVQGAEIKKKSTSSRASPSTTNSPATSWISPRRAPSSTRTSSSPSACGSSRKRHRSMASPRAGTTSGCTTTRGRSTASSPGPTTRSTSGGSPTRCVTAGRLCTARIG